ncbi:unnamed protein product [Amaranthus hypochondriacus]
MDSIVGSSTWVLIELPPSCIFIGCKLIFRKKIKVDSTIDKFCRLVAKGFTLRPCADCFNTYALVARKTPIRFLIGRSCNTSNGCISNFSLWRTRGRSLYYKTTGRVCLEGQKSKVCKLIESLYELKQAPKHWHEILLWEDLLEGNIL